ncbi:polycystin-2-like [Zootermopsis nevadensis]|uniref:Polycystin-2 n=1 Tax=Zootermopsis nevadensis TaxID=136037 RepID=A0A067RIF6_ZOONE|nr:polycystin-2-like [Zootermopsis nevadensis]KDR20220.1 Polycystin-2 [Zootermopsis nevadensis]
MERDCEQGIFNNTSPSDQGSNQSDSDNREGHRSKSSGKSQKGYLQGMKQKVLAYIKTNKKGIKVNYIEFIIYTIFLLIVTIGTFGQINNMRYWYTKLVDDLFVKSPFEEGIEEINFKDLSRVTHFWKFAETVMIDGLYWNFEDDTQQPVGYMLQDSKLIGVPRLRQVKVRSDSCIVPEAFQRLYTTCYDLYSSGKEDKEPFGPGIGTAWTYSTEKKLHGSSHSGIFSTYGGGGYYEDLSLDRSETIEKLLTLKNNRWITRGTRAIFLDFTVYNSNINIFLTVKLVFEKPPVGGMITSSLRRIVKLHHYVTGFDYVIAVCECMFVVFTVFYTIEEIVEIVVLKHKYLHSLWNFLDQIILVLAYAIICFRLYSYKVIEPQIIQVIGEEKFTDFDSIGLYQVTYNTTTAVLACLTLFKVFKYTRFYDTMSQFSMTLARCSTEIAAFLCMFLIIFIIFAQLGYLLFGSQVKDFRTLPTTVSTLSRATIGDFDFLAVEEASPILARFFYISFVFLVFFILLNVFLAIITDSYAGVRSLEPTLKSFIGSDIHHGLNNLTSQLGYERKNHSEDDNKDNDKYTYKEIKKFLLKKNVIDVEDDLFLNIYDTDEENKQNKK